MKTTLPDREPVNWLSVITYYVLACAISWPFFWWRDVETASFNAWELPFIVKTWTYMWGPGIAVLIVSFLFKQNRQHPNRVSLFGTSAWKSALYWFVPFILLAIPGLDNSWGMNKHLFPIAAMGCLGFISIIGEDLGWSYFLKNALLGLSPVKRSILIGAMWELWHFTNRTTHKTVLQAILTVLFMMAVLILLIHLMSKITDRTQSLITAVTAHMWLNVLVENGCTPVYIVFGISLVFWTLMLIYWKRPEPRTEQQPV